MASPHPLLHHADVWRFGEEPRTRRAGLATGFAALAEALPDGAWPHHLIELLCDEVGIGELSVLSPALAEQTGAGRSTAWVHAPYWPHAPSLDCAGIKLAHLFWVRVKSDQDALWATERLAMSGACAAVVLWCRNPMAYTTLQRLSMAAVRGQCPVFLYRPSVAAQTPSPAALRIHLESEAGELKLTLIKRRGALYAKAIRLATSANAWPARGAADGLRARDERIRHTEGVARRSRLNMLADSVHVPLFERRYPVPDR
jgi:protein ImuA